MDLVVALFVGGVVGWLAGLVLGTDDRMGMLASVLAGVVGGVLGRWLADGVGAAGVPARGLASALAAAVLIGIVRAVRPDRGARR